MNKLEPKYRRQLNKDQLEVLELLYKFRFGTSDLVASYFGKSNGIAVHRRLKILLDQGYIARRYEPRYKLLGKPAAYYLTAKSSKVLSNNREPEDNQINIKGIYKNKTVSEDFVSHCLDIFRLYLDLKNKHGSDLSFFTRADIYGYDYFIRPLPDAYLSLDNKHRSGQYYLIELLSDHSPAFATRRRLQQYIRYCESGEWEAETDQALPKVLFVCNTDRLKKQVGKLIDKYEYEIESADAKVEAVTLAELSLTTDS